MNAATAKAVNEALDRYSEYTRGEDEAAPILVFLGRTVPMRGIEFGCDDEFHAGGQLINELASCYEARSALPKWNARQCADVLHYLHNIEPRQGCCFCRDSGGHFLTNLTCGFHTILSHVEDCLRGVRS
jgi:hypothetical protein